MYKASGKKGNNIAVNRQNIYKKEQP